MDAGGQGLGKGNKPMVYPLSQTLSPVGRGLLRHAPTQLVQQMEHKPQKNRQDPTSRKAFAARRPVILLTPILSQPLPY